MDVPKSVHPLLSWQVCVLELKWNLTLFSFSSLPLDVCFFVWILSHQIFRGLWANLGDVLFFRKTLFLFWITINCIWYDRRSTPHTAGSRVLDAALLTWHRRIHVLFPFKKESILKWGNTSWTSYRHLDVIGRRKLVSIEATSREKTRRKKFH